MIAVGQRIPRWLKINYDQNEMLLLPPQDPFTLLLVRDQHEKDHLGVDATVAKIRTRFWIPGLKKIVKQMRRSCVECRKLNKRTQGQIMGQLPPERLVPSPPFCKTALDIFGPITIKDTVKKRVKGKAYGIVFNCLFSRAVHLDVMDGYDTKAFLEAFSRFTSMRGYHRSEVLCRLPVADSMLIQ